MTLKNWILSACVRSFLMSVGDLVRVSPKEGSLEMRERSRSVLEFTDGEESVTITLGESVEVDGARLSEEDIEEYRSLFYFLYDVLALLVHSKIRVINFKIAEGEEKTSVKREDIERGYVTFKINGIGRW